MKDDIASIRTAITKFVIEKEEDVILVMHSGGGFIGSNAIEGLGSRERKEKGMKGGVVKIVFLAAAVFPVGFRHGALPFTVSEGGALYPINPRTLLFNDLSDEEAETWMKELKSQPAEGWDDTITYAGWTDVPSVYLVCEGDQCIPPPMQEQLASLAGSRVERCDAGHMVMLSLPERVVEVIRGAAV